MAFSADTMVLESRDRLGVWWQLFLPSTWLRCWIDNDEAGPFGLLADMPYSNIIFSTGIAQVTTPDAARTHPRTRYREAEEARAPRRISDPVSINLRLADVIDCDQCGGRHEGLAFMRGPLGYRGSCPETGRPILLVEEER